MDAWDELGNSRPASFGGVMPIPISEILAYCTLYRIVWDDVRADLVYFCGKLDDVYCGWAACKDEEREGFLREQRELLKEAENGYC